MQMKCRFHTDKTHQLNGGFFVLFEQAKIRTSEIYKQSLSVNVVDASKIPGEI